MSAYPGDLHDQRRRAQIQPRNKSPRASHFMEEFPQCLPSRKRYICMSHEQTIYGLIHAAASTNIPYTDGTISASEYVILMAGAALSGGKEWVDKNLS